MKTEQKTVMTAQHAIAVAHRLNSNKIKHAADLASAFKTWFPGSDTWPHWFRDWLEDDALADSIWEAAQPSPRTAARVIDTAKSLGYTPDAVEAFQRQAEDTEKDPAIIDFVLRLEEKLPPLRVVHDVLHGYKDGSWEPMSIDAVTCDAYRVMPHRVQRSSVVNEVISTLLQKNHYAGKLNPPIRFGDNRQVVFVNVANGVLKVTPDRCEMLPHSSAYGFRSSLPVKYDPDAKCPLFEKTLDAVLPAVDDVKADQQAVLWVGGWMLYPSLEHKMCVVIYGSTDTGKTTVFYFGFASIFSNEQKTSLGLSDICGHPAYQVPDMEYAMVNIGGELNASEVADSSRFKQLCGGERVPVRRIRGEPYDMTGYTVKMLFLSNHLPMFRSGTDAETNRVKIIHFHTPLKKDSVDRGYQDRMSATERDGIFSRYMVEALQCILDGAEMPGSSLETQRTRAQFAESNDPDERFMAECADLGKDHEVSRQAFKSAWKTWASENDFSEKMVSGVNGAMRRICSRFGIESVRAGQFQGPRRRIYQGVQLKPGYMPTQKQIEDDSLNG